MGNIHINYISTGTFSSESNLMALTCDHENFEEEDGNDGRVYCSDCDAIGIICEEQEHEGYDDNGVPEYSTHKWVEWITP